MDNKKTTNTNSKRQKCEIYSRPVGYLRTVSSWNDAKKEEYQDRKTYEKQQDFAESAVVC